MIKLVLGMITLSSCSTSSSALNNIVFVSNAKLEKIEPKIENVSEVKHGKGKSISGSTT